VDNLKDKLIEEFHHRWARLRGVLSTCAVRSSRFCRYHSACWPPSSSCAIRGEREPDVAGRHRNCHRAMIDAAIVMIENAHKHLEAYDHEHPGEQINDGTALELIAASAAEVGRRCSSRFSSSRCRLSQCSRSRGRREAVLSVGLHQDLHHCRCCRVVGDAGAVLMGYLIRGRIPHENSNPINRVLIRLYRPLLEATLRRPWVAIGLAVVALAASVIPLSQLGGDSCHRSMKATCYICRTGRSLGFRPKKRGLLADDGLLAVAFIERWHEFAAELGQRNHRSGQRNDRQTNGNPRRRSVASSNGR